MARNSKEWLDMTIVLANLYCFFCNFFLYSHSCHAYAGSSLGPYDIHTVVCDRGLSYILQFMYFHHFIIDGFLSVIITGALTRQLYVAINKTDL